MKTNLADYVLSSLFLTIAGVLAFVAALVVAPAFSSPVFGVYSVVFDVLFFLLMFGLSCAALARTILRFRPLSPGRHEMNSPVFAAWKLYTVMYEFGCGALKPFSVMFLRPLVQVLFGARIGPDVALGGKLVDPHLIRIGEGAIIGEGSVLTAHAITSGAIVLGLVEIESGATIGVGAVIYPGVTVGSGSIVAANAVVSADTKIGRNEFWAGIPARKTKSLIADGRTD